MLQPNNMPLLNQFQIRPYTDEDYDDFLRIDTRTQSREFWGEADWHPIHPPCPETPEANRYVAIDTASSQIVGYGAVLLATQSNLDVMVHPEWQRRGVGRALWERMQQDLSAFGTVSVGPWVRAANPVACAWVEAMGFSHIQPDAKVQLSVSAADLSRFASVPARMEQQGITLTTLAAEKQTNPDCLTMFYTLFQNVPPDVPGYTPDPTPSYEQCMQDLAKPGMQLESVFIAKHSGKYVGLSILGCRVTAEDIRFAGGANCFSQHLTGVHPDYRRRGIALALKLRTVEYAQQQGGERILTSSDNPAMRDLNQKLGFRTGPWFIYSKTLG